MSVGHESVYVAAGVDYDVLDAAKRTALTAARSLLEYPGGRAALDARSFGEPASIVEVGGLTLATVLECLGTKSELAREFEAATGIDRYSAIGYDTVAAIVNDCICVGALPFIVHAYVATGSAAFYDGSRHASLVEGFLRGCRDSGATWGGGESPTLAGLITPDGVDLAGSTVGRVPEGSRPIFGEELAPGDEVVLIASSGLHQNGASLARLVASTLPDGLTTVLDDGRLFGDALLDEGINYVRLVDGLIADGTEIHYLSHLTGHGLRKLMRANREVGYRITELPPVPVVLRFLVDHAPAMSVDDAYGTLNMGAGFAVIVPDGRGEAAVRCAQRSGYTAIVGGRVEEGDRRVVLEPLDVTYDASALGLR